ncbi:DUF3135 domain-containing protein, partial [bacterium]|nr:DUF3135 domain-containing protein [bacterium]
GIERTFAELEKHFTDEPLTQLVDQVLQAQSPHDVAELAQNHPELLSDNTTKLIAHIITEARQKNQADLAEALEQRHAPLRQLQTATATHITLNTMMFQYVVRRVRQ